MLHLVNAMKRLDTDLLEELDRELSDVFPATKDLLYYFLDAPAAAASVAAGLAYRPYQMFGQDIADTSNGLLPGCPRDLATKTSGPGHTSRRRQAAER